MAENLLTMTSVKLFGRVMADLVVNKAVYTAGQPGNNLLHSQLTGTDPRLAHIYGFAYEGAYFDIPRPTIFLVQGEGAAIVDPTSGTYSVDQTAAVGMDSDFGKATQKKSDLRTW